MHGRQSGRGAGGRVPPPSFGGWGHTIKCPPPHLFDHLDQEAQVLHCVKPKVSHGH